MKYHTVVTHKRPHPDEAAAIALLRYYDKVEPNAKIIFVDAGYTNFQGRDPQEMEKAGIVQVGVGSGRFNEHANPNDARKKSHTAATLVAKALGIEKNPELATVLNWVRSNDLEGKGAYMDVANAMRAKYRIGKSDLEVLKWAIEEFEDQIRDQRALHKQAIPELAKATFGWLRLPGGKKLKIALIKSDNDQILSAARAKNELGISILVVERSSGNVQVLPLRKDLAPFMCHVAARIRLFEARIAQLEMKYDDRRLFQEAVIPGMPSWHFQVETGMVMNGSLTATGIKPTRLPLESFEEILASSLSYAFQPKVQEMTKARFAA